MNFKYKIESNGKNRLINRSYYQKKSDFIIFEVSKKEFLIISDEYPKDIWESKEPQKQLFQFKDLKYGDSNNKIYFSSGINKEDQKTIRGISKEWNKKDYLKKNGWKFLGQSSSIYGESNAVRTPFNNLEVSGYNLEIEYLTISTEEYIKYKNQGVTEAEHKNIFYRLNTNTGFIDSDIELSINGNVLSSIYDQIEKSLKNASKESPFKIPTPCIIHERWFKGASYSLDIYEEFDIKKFRISTESFSWNKGKGADAIIYEPIYDENSFEFIEGGWEKSSDWYIIDEKNNVSYLDIKNEDDDEDFEDDEE